MIKQTLMFSSPATLSLRDKQLVIRVDGGENDVTRPIEDIGCVLIENQQVRITIPLLNELADNNVAVVLCDSKAMPHAMLMSLEGNTTLQESYKYQIDAAQPCKKQLWKQLIEGKIYNQATLLRNLGKDGDVLKPYYMNVKSGDADNREGGASRIYWGMLFDNQFRRDRDGEPPNNLLNYGYSILRAATARALIGSGLYPAFGIFHRNRYNAFPLADDVMEPYRPFVDDIVYRLFFQECQRELTRETKATLLRVLFSDVKMGKVTRPLQIALSLTTASLLKVYKGEAKQLSLPQIV